MSRFPVRLLNPSFAHVLGLVQPLVLGPERDWSNWLTDSVALDFDERVGLGTGPTYFYCALECTVYRASSQNFTAL